MLRRLPIAVLGSTLLLASGCIEKAIERSIGKALAESMMDHLCPVVGALWFSNVEGRPPESTDDLTLGLAMGDIRCDVSRFDDVQFYHELDGRFQITWRRGESTGSLTIGPTAEANPGTIEQ